MSNFYSTYAEAIAALRPNASFTIIGNNYDTLVWQEEGSNPPTLQEIEVKFAEMLTAKNASEYARDRATAYPKIADQLDMLYHDIKNGTLNSGAWIQTIEAVKTEYPKP